MDSEPQSKTITRRGRMVRIGIGAFLMVLNGASLGSWYEPLVGWSLAGGIWMGLNVFLSLYLAYHLVQLSRQSRPDQ
jgi:hypothetical protein